MADYIKIADCIKADYDKLEDYDKIFERGIDQDSIYTDYPGGKMIVGKISLDNARARLSKGE